MKKLILIIPLVILNLIARAQQITYQILEDEPTKAYTKFIAPEIGTEYNSTCLSLFMGANGRFGLTDALVLEGIARYDLYHTSGSGAQFLTEAGVFLPLTSKNKTKEDVPVVLSYNPYAGTTYQNGQSYRVEETKYLKVPTAQFLNKIGVRGGGYLRRTGSDNLTETAHSGITLGGVYLGGQWTSQAYVKTKVNNEVERIGAGFTRVYFDFLALPVTSMSDPTANDGVKKDGAIGWRLGYQWYVSPHDGDYKFLSNSVFSAEIGKRPLTGFLFNLSWGFAFMSSR